MPVGITVSLVSCQGDLPFALYAAARLSTPLSIVQVRLVEALDYVERAMRSPGTVTDAVLVAVPERQGESIHHAGPATELGQRATQLVYELVVALDAYDLFERALGATRREFSQAFAALLKEAPLPVKEGEELRELDKFLKDPNVWALILAASELDAMRHGVAKTAALMFVAFSLLPGLKWLPTPHVTPTIRSED